MDDLSFARYFRLRPGGIECDAEGLRVGGVALLERDAKGAWGRRDERDLSRELSKRYGFSLDIERKRKGVDAITAALANGELARAQIAALLLQLPDPPTPSDVHPDGLQKRRLAACGLLKADADWDEKHPRIGTPPNPGWFAPASEAPAADGPKNSPESAAIARTRDGATLAFVASGQAAAVDSVLAEGLSDAARRGLATLAARFSAATILFDAIFVPSDNRIVEEGRIPGRPDVAYRWAHDQTATAVTLKVLIDGEWRTLAVGGAGPDSLVYDRNSRAVARVVSGPDRQQTLVATVDALDRAVADLRGKDGQPVAAPTTDDREPKLCPDPRKESETNNSANAIAYQEYVTGLPHPWAIFFGGVWFDGCDPRTGIFLDGKANMDFLFDAEDKLKDWVKEEKNPANQMQRQSDVVTAAGRAVVWHAQTEKTFRGLKKIVDEGSFPNLSVVFDPN